MARDTVYVAPIHPQWTVVMIGKSVYVRKSYLDHVLRLPVRRARTGWRLDLTPFTKLRPVRRS